MDSDNIQKAIEDLDEIRRVLNETFENISSASKLFTLAGAIWIAEGVLYLLSIFSMWRFLPSTDNPAQEAHIFTNILSALSVVGFIAILYVYLMCRKLQKRKAGGLGLSLLDLWGSVLVGVPALAWVVQKILYFVLNEATILPIRFILQMAAVALASFMTGNLINRSAPKVMALIFICLNIIIIAIPTTINSVITQDMEASVSLGILVGMDIIPGVFIAILGCILRRKEKSVI